MAANGSGDDAMHAVRSVGPSQRARPPLTSPASQPAGGAVLAAPAQGLAVGTADIDITAIRKAIGADPAVRFLCMDRYADAVRHRGKEDEEA